MAHSHFSLPVGRAAQILPGPQPAELHIPLCGHHILAACNERVVRGQQLAAHPDPLFGDVCAPLAGVVAEINNEFIRLYAEYDGQALEPENLRVLSGEELRQALRRLGHDTHNLQPAATLVVNGMNPEPGVVVAETLLVQENETVAQGLTLALAACGAREVMLVRSAGAGGSMGDLAVVETAPVYPNSLNPLAVKAATGKENPKDAACVDVHFLHRLGQSAVTGLPADHAVVCVAEAAFRVIPGTPASELLHAAGLRATTRDRVILGGPFRGRALYSTSQGTASDDYAICRIPADRQPLYTDAACVNCGECALICPARIRPNMLSRYAEFRLFKRAQDAHLHSCMECGLCSWVCPVNRPVLQYIMLAKKEIDAQAPVELETTG